MRIALIYDSKTGNTAKMAQSIEKGMLSVEGTEVRSFHIGEVDVDYVKGCSAMVLGSPTYNGYTSAKMKAWMEEELNKLDVCGKLTGAYATAAYVHGGGDLAVQCMITHLMVAGSMTYSGGAALGAPVIHLGPVAISSELEKYDEIFQLYGKRMAEQAKKLE